MRCTARRVGVAWLCLFVASALALEEILPPLKLPDGMFADRPPTSLSVVIPAHNAAANILLTLRSVQSSIMHFLISTPEASTMKTEVVIVDDGSTDNTVSTVVNFIHQQRLDGAGFNPEWKLVALLDRVTAGTARNIGVEHSTGEVLFFLDADDLYHQDHISTCFSALRDGWQRRAMATTRVKVMLKGIVPEWKQQIESMIPHNRCLFRKLFEFVEGFPEQAVFAKHEDMAFLQVMVYSAKIPVAQLSKETVTYQLYPGNSLDRARERLVRPMSESPPSEESLAEDRPVRLALIKHHIVHLQQKAQRHLAESNTHHPQQGQWREPSSPHWAVVRRAVREEGGGNWNAVDVPRARFVERCSFLSSFCFLFRVSKDLIRFFLAPPRVEALLRFGEVEEEEGRKGLAGLIRKLAGEVREAIVAVPDREELDTMFTISSAELRTNVTCW
ncbi:putative teichuronic acid biosynthesis glycosyltransferase TuaG [Balamuthia mandrillaris]